jgi:DivIVA domain-containing protein
MLALEVLGGAIVLLGLAFVLSRELPLLDDESDDSRDIGLPTERQLRSDDIARLRFRIGLRGYRMSDVDAALEAAREALSFREREFERHQPPPITKGPLARRPTRPPEEPALADPVLAEQPPPAVIDRPLTELEEMHQPTATDDAP